MRRLLVFATIALFLIVGYIFSISVPAEAPREITPSRTISINGVRLQVAIADTDALRAQGLSDTSPLKEGEGLLFVFAEDGRYSFWMKDMRYPIDILWLDAEGAVVYIEKNASPESYPTSFTPHSLARYVLEVRAGFADQYDIQIGTRANLGE